jgi:hypothetical protein
MGIMVIRLMKGWKQKKNNNIKNKGKALVRVKEKNKALFSKKVTQKKE